MHSRLSWRPRLPVVIAALAVATLLVVLVPLSVWMRASAEARLLKERVALLQRLDHDWTDRLNLRFSAAEESASRFADLVSTLPSDNPAEAATFDALVHQDADGAWRSVPETFNAATDAAIWLQRGHYPPSEAKSFLIQVKALTETFGPGALGLFADTWVIPRQGGIVLFWPDQPGWIYDVAPDLDPTEDAWTASTQPTDGGAGTARWTSAAWDRTAKMWMISVIAPYYRDGAWAGAVGHDLPLDALAEQLEALTIHEDAEAMVARSDGVLLASTRLQDKIQSSEGHLSVMDLREPEVASCFLDAQADTAPTHLCAPDGDENVVTVTRVAAPGWSVVTRTPQSEVLAAVRATYTDTWRPLLALMLLFSLAAPWLVSRLIVPPVSRLTRNACKVADGDLEYRASPEWISEFHTMSESIGSMVESLKESIHRYRAFFDRGADGVVIIDPESTGIIDFNNRACEQLGYSREEFSRLTIADIEVLETPADTRRRVDDILAEGHGDFLTKQRTKNGEIRDIHVTVDIIQVGDRPAYHAVWRDITERTRTETELRQSEARFRALVENAPEAIVVFDANEGQFQDCNEKACRLFGMSPQELLTKGPVALSPPTQPNGRSSAECAREVIDQAAAGGLPRFEWVHRNAAGEDIPCEINLARLPSSNGPTIRASIVDITDRKQAEEERARLQQQLGQAQKMESVGRLAGGVAHDFNNMLGVILGHSELALEQLDSSSPVLADIREVHTAALRSAELTRQLLTFARKQTVSLEVLDLNEEVERTLKMMRRLIGENIELTWKPSAGLWPVNADATQIHQILANLCVNARDAIENVGRLTIETGNTTVPPGRRVGTAVFTPGDYVRLDVSDNGCGMDEQTQACVFEPFFTTKPLGEGTGLGLSTVYGAVKQHQGFITVDSAPGTGTRFSIFLPRHQGSDEEDGTAPVDNTLAPGSETVLLVEDEAAILTLTERLLRAQGYHVLPAATPGEAIRLARDATSGIHLLITDVIMPEMNGRDLAEAVRGIHPGVGCLFMSGYAADVIAHRGILGPDTRFLQKPFGRVELAAAVRDVLDG